MVFIKRVGIVLLAFTLAGCELLAKKDTGGADDSEATEQVAPEQGDSDSLPSIEAMPNPYLTQEVNVPDQAKAEYATALAAMSEKQWQKAEGLLQLLSETWPTLSGPWVNLGIAQAHQEKMDAAEASFKKALELNRLNNDAYIQLGVFYREQGKFAEAEQTYLAALKVWPHNPQALRNLGILYDLYMGKFEQALAQYRLLSQILPEEDRQLKGWILDLERRISELEATEQ